MDKVIHWSDTFPAFFPEVIASFCNALGAKKHLLLHIDNRQLIKFEKNTIHVVHGFRNAEPLIELNLPNLILFIHGMPESYAVNKVNRLIKCGSFDKVLVSTPDLLCFQDSQLFPYVPVDLLGTQTSKSTADVSKGASQLYCYSTWKGSVWHMSVDYASGHMPASLYKIKRGCIEKIKPKLLQRDKKYNLYFGSKGSPVKRLARVSRQSLLNELAMLKPIMIDSDHTDFRNGGCLSVTAIQNLYLGGQVVAYISKRNLDVLQNSFGFKIKPQFVANTKEEIMEVANHVVCGNWVIQPSSLVKKDVTKIGFEIWKKVCPEFF